MFREALSIINRNIPTVVPVQSKTNIREGYRGINELDRMCKLHNKFYNENSDTKVILL